METKVLFPNEKIRIKCPNPENPDEYCIYRITALQTSYDGDDLEVFIEESQ